MMAGVLITAMIVSITPSMDVRQEIRAEEEFHIISPKENNLIGAGSFDVKWTNAGENVKEYKIYVDGQLIGTTKNTVCECYTTSVETFSLRVEAVQPDGSVKASDRVDFSVTKKGLCVNDTMGRYLLPEEMNMGWYYNWGTSPFSLKAYKNIDYVPMIWGTASEAGLSSIAAKNYMYLLGYNEPDMGANVGGSNITVISAINRWNNLVNKSRYLGSPAPALSPSWDSGTWFRSFMSRIDTDTIDFIPLHCYYNTYGGAAGANTFLKEVVDKTYEMYHKPIWVTEFGVSGWGYDNVAKRESVKEFLKTAIDGLNERPYVERYSWFSFNTTDNTNGASALWTNATGELTELGKTYVEYGNPKGYTYTPSTNNENYQVDESKEKHCSMTKL